MLYSSCKSPEGLAFRLFLGQFGIPSPVLVTIRIEGNT